MINILTERTENARKKHLNGLKNEILERARKRLRVGENLLNQNDYDTLLAFFELNRAKILTAEQVELINLQNKLFGEIPDHDNLNLDLKSILNYKWFRGFKKTKYSGFTLAKNLNVEVCPYCNLNYTKSHSIDGKSKNVFPEFDHFLPQSNFPLLTLSFYNLIPSCGRCNTHFKLDYNPLDENLINPYAGYNPIRHFNFSFSPNDFNSLVGRDSNFTIDIETNRYNSPPRIKDQVESSLEFFNIVESYSKNHKGLIKEIINKRIANSDKYIESLSTIYNISFEEAYRILFEGYYEDEKLMKRPFSKLKKDIFNEIESL